MLSRGGRTLVILVAVIASVSQTAVAQDRLADARTLYDTAAYEDALKLLDQLSGPGATPEVHQYRALCLIALGRADAAERAIEVVLAANPFFTPDSREVAPRVVAMFAETRRKLLPQMVRRVFAEARTLFRDGDRRRAIERFDEVIRLLDDTALSEDQELADLKLVASGFVELSRAQPPAVQPVRPTQPAEATTPAATASANPTTVAEPRNTVVTPPVAISQVLPQWRPPDASTARRGFSGAVRVIIDADGKVTSAEIERSVYPPYDRAVLEAARGWLYKPATRNGKPIGSETTVEIKLGPVRN